MLRICAKCSIFAAQERQERNIQRMLDISTRYEDINKDAWAVLVARSPWATWFQTPEAYLFYAALPDEMHPFVASVTEVGELTGVIVGYLTQEKSALKQFFTRRAIIIGGPLLDEHISPEALTALLLATEQASGNPIYIETRNFHDYSPFRSVFEACGWEYKPHLNICVDTGDKEAMWECLSESRKRQVKKAEEQGVEIMKAQSEDEVRAFYRLLKHRYATHIRLPLFSETFFLTFFRKGYGVFLLAKYEGKIIGGMMCPISQQSSTLYEWFVVGDDARYSKQYPSVAITYGAMQYAHEEGLKCFDFMGAGVPDEPYGVRDFKIEFGGELVEYGRFVNVRHRNLYKSGCIGIKIVRDIR